MQLGKGSKIGGIVWEYRKNFLIPVPGRAEPEKRTLVVIAEIKKDDRHIITNYWE